MAPALHIPRVPVYHAFVYSLAGRPLFETGHQGAKSEMAEKWQEKFNGVCRDLPATVARWKEKHRGKAVGWALTDVPEELVIAAGALPAALLAENVRLVEADKHFQGFACSYSRSVLELLAAKQLEFLDGVIVPYICDTTRALDLVVKFNQFLPWTDCLRIPKTTVGQGIFPYYRQELERLRNRLAELTGHYPDAEEIRAAIIQVNRVKTRLDQIRALLREKPGLIAAAEYFGAVRASLTLPKDEAAKLADEFLADVEKRKPVSAASADSTPVILAGKVAEPPAVVELIEAAGLRVVDDSLVLGGRYAAARADENADPMDALVRRQLTQWPMVGVWDERPERASFLIERARASRAKGAVFLVQKFCEPWEIDYPGMKEALDQEGIPSLRLETEYQMGSLEPLRTRVEAFAEMLG